MKRLAVEPAGAEPEADPPIGHCQKCGGDLRWPKQTLCQQCGIDKAGLERRRQDRRSGVVQLVVAEQMTGIDRHLLRELYEAGVIDGERHGRSLRLSRASLARYVWSRPRCPLDGCGRRVLGRGPGCTRHRRYTDETIQKMRASASDRTPRVKLRCERAEWDDCPHPEFELPPYRVGRDHPRFCSRYCASMSREISQRTLDSLKEAREDRDRKIEAARANGLLLPADVSETLPPDVSRSPQAIREHIRRGWLPVVAPSKEIPRGVGLVTPDAVAVYVTTLREYPDGRLRRFSRRRFRERWTLGVKAGALFHSGYSTAEAGRELGYTADYIAKLWRRHKVTQEVAAARQRRRLLALIRQPGACADLRDVYRALSMSAAEAAALVEDLELRSVIKCERQDRRVILRRVSEKAD